MQEPAPIDCRLHEQDNEAGLCTCLENNGVYKNEVINVKKTVLEGSSNEVQLCCSIDDRNGTYASLYAILYLESPTSNSAIAERLSCQRDQRQLSRPSLRGR